MGFSWTVLPHAASSAPGTAAGLQDSNKELRLCRARTDIVGHSSHPTWNENFCILVADEVDSVNFLVKDDNLIGEPRCAMRLTGSCAPGLGTCWEAPDPSTSSVVTSSRHKQSAPGGALRHAGGVVGSTGTVHNL